MTANGHGMTSTVSGKNYGKTICEVGEKVAEENAVVVSYLQDEIDCPKCLALICEN